MDIVLEDIKSLNLNYFMVHSAIDDKVIDKDKIFNNMEDFFKMADEKNFRTFEFLATLYFMFSCVCKEVDKNTIIIKQRRNNDNQT